MNTVADSQWVIQWMTHAQRAIEQHHGELTELDRAIGDGDHGENMRRGFNAVTAKLTPAPLISDTFQTIATTLMTTVGGAAGPLFATAFLRAALVTKVSELEPHHVVSILQAMLEGVAARGSAEVGDKTMVDALDAALQEASASLDAGGGVAELWRAASTGASRGAASTDALVARKGRASYLGQRSQGHRDPGAQSVALIFEAAAETFTEGTGIRV